MDNVNYSHKNVEIKCDGCGLVLTEAQVWCTHRVTGRGFDVLGGNDVYHPDSAGRKIDQLLERLAQQMRKLEALGYIDIDIDGIGLMLAFDEEADRPDEMIELIVQREKDFESHQKELFARFMAEQETRRLEAEHNALLELKTVVDTKTE